MIRTEKIRSSFALLKFKKLQNTQNNDYVIVNYYKLLILIIRMIMFWMLWKDCWRTHCISKIAQTWRQRSIPSPTRKWLLNFFNLYMTQWGKKLRYTYFLRVDLKKNYLTRVLQVITCECFRHCCEYATTRLQLLSIVCLKNVHLQASHSSELHILSLIVHFYSIRVRAPSPPENFYREHGAEF